MVDPASYRPKGDKRNTAFFEEFLPRVYDRRASSGLEQVVGPMAGIVIQVDHGNGLPYLAELTITTPYRYQECWLNATHRIYLLKGGEAFPRLIVLEPLSDDFEDEITRWNAMYPLSTDKPNARYIGEIYRVSSCADLRAILEPQNIRFAYPGETVNPFYASKHLCFTFLSDYTYNRVGYVDRPLDGLAVLDLGDQVLLDEEALAPLTEAAKRHREHGLEGLILGIDHLATRVLAGEREDAILEYLTMVPYYYWGSYDIAEMNSSTNVTRHPSVADDKLSPARVFTANNTPSYLNSLTNLPMPTEDYVRNFGRRMHHIAYEVAEGEFRGEKNVDHVVRTLRQLGVAFLADPVGECGEEPNLRQIFSRTSPYSLLITEYVERCMGYEGFFTRENVAALTEAAGQVEHYEHGQVFD